MIKINRYKTPLSAAEIDELFDRVTPLLNHDHARLLIFSDEHPDLLSWAQAQGDILVDMEICYKEELSYYLKERRK